MAEAGTADLIADLLLRHYREPMRYRGQAAREAEALGHLNVVLRLALGRPVEFSNPVLQGPAVTAELERAAAFYIQQNFFREGASHYEILGLARDAAADSVRENFRLLMQLVHPDRHGADTEWPEGYAARANRAYSVLKGAQTRAEYDRQQATARAQQSGGRAPASSVHAASAAARTHVPARSGPTRRPLPAPMLPEWLTAGVGGFILRHPGLTVFSALIAVSALVIGAFNWPEPEHALNAASTYTLPEPIKRPAANRSRATEAPSVERNAGLEPGLAAPALSEPTPAPPVVAVAVPGQVRSNPVVAPPPRPAPVAPAAPVMPAPTADSVAAGAPAPGTPARTATRLEPPATRAAAVPDAAQVRVAQVPQPSPRSGAVMPPAVPVSPPAPAALPVAPTPQPAIAAPPAPVPPPVQSVATYQPANPPSVVVSNAVAAVPATPERVVIVALPPPGGAEVETLIANFISSYESGRLSVLGGLFHDDAQTNQQRGRAAIVSEYDQLFRSTTVRRMTISQMRWQAVGDKTEAKGELTVKTSWRDGREAEQRVAVDMEFVRQGGRAVISRLGMQPR